MQPLAAVTETLDRAFDWGSAAVGAGAGAAVVLLCVAVGVVLRTRGASSRRRDGSAS